MALGCAWSVNSAAVESQQRKTIGIAKGENIVERMANTVAESTKETVTAALSVVPLPPANPPVVEPGLVSPGALRLLVDTEVGSPALYTRRFQRPVWPGGASGPTIGIGYDLGMQTGQNIATDWSVHPQVDRLRAGSGMSGTRGQQATRTMQDVVTPYPMAYGVFRDRSIVKYYRITRRAFPGMDKLGKNAQGGLISLVYNRGGTISCAPNSSRYEMCVIRDVCVPARDTACIASQLRAMKRVWKGSSIERGMSVRREHEAKLAETPDA